MKRYPLDIFGRTTTQLQTDITEDIFLKLNENGFLKERMTAQLYCEETPITLVATTDLCGSLLEPLELVKPRCKVDGSTPVTRDTKRIFLELDKLQPEVEAFFQASSENGYEDKVIYSWFDACIGYVSITACLTDQWEKWWRNPDDVQLHQSIGKDNVVYHSVIFPASQIGTRDPWTKLHHLSTADYEFTWDTFISANNNLLLKNLCNFVSRLLKFVNSRHYDNVVPDWTISQRGNSFLQSNKLDNSLRQYEPSKCAAVISLAVNLVHLLASLLAPHMFETATLINEQLRAELFPIPDHWSADSIKPGHEIGQAKHLFSRISPERRKNGERCSAARRQRSSR
ncbi:hypothetical protein VTK56DRAFT_2091 [Thermocarpiscus australiensis]